MTFEEISPFLQRGSYVYREPWKIKVRTSIGLNETYFTIRNREGFNEFFQVKHFAFTPEDLKANDWRVDLNDARPILHKLQTALDDQDAACEDCVFNRGECPGEIECKPIQGEPNVGMFGFKNDDYLNRYGEGLRD